MQGIIAGNGNTIPPELDAGIRKIILNTNGQFLNVVYDSSTAKYEFSGIAFARGVVCLFDPEEIALGSDGYVYVDFTMHFDPDVADEGTLYFSSTALATQEDNIDQGAGTYRLLVGTMSGGTYSSQNYVSMPLNAYNAEVAERVTGTIANSVSATTQDISDNSNKVATTRFVRNLVQSYLKQSTISAPNISTSKNACYNRLNLVGIQLFGTWSGGSVIAGDTIATVPVGYRPSQDVIVPYLSTVASYDREFLATIHSDGRITISYGIGNGADFKLNCCYTIS